MRTSRNDKFLVKNFNDNMHHVLPRWIQEKSVNLELNFKKRQNLLLNWTLNRLKVKARLIEKATPKEHFNQIEEIIMIG